MVTFVPAGNQKPANGSRRPYFVSARDKLSGFPKDSHLCMLSLLVHVCCVFQCKVCHQTDGWENLMNKMMSVRLGLKVAERTRDRDLVKA